MHPGFISAIQINFLTIFMVQAWAVEKPFAQHCLHVNRKAAQPFHHS
jgi:hypothetical protein